jgi:hypothetical protein
MTKTNIYIFGNEHVSTDTAAVQLLPDIERSFPEVGCIHADPTDEWLEPTDTDVIIVDSVHGIAAVTLFTDPGVFAKTVRTSVHDFDLSTELPLLLKIGRISSVVIIGIPPTVTDSVRDEALHLISILLKKRGIISE